MARRGDSETDTELRRALATVRRARTALIRLRAQERELTADRDDAILTLVGHGLSYQAIARESGLTRGRIGQIAHRRLAAEPGL